MSDFLAASLLIRAAIAFEYQLQERFINYSLRLVTL